MEKEKTAIIDWNDNEIEIVIFYKEIDTSFVDSEGSYYKRYIQDAELELVEVTVSAWELLQLSDGEQAEFCKWLNENQEDIFYQYVVNA